MRVAAFCREEEKKEDKTVYVVDAVLKFIMTSVLVGLVSGF